MNIQVTKYVLLCVTFPYLKWVKKLELQYKTCLLPTLPATFLDCIQIFTFSFSSCLQITCDVACAILVYTFNLALCNMNSVGSYVCVVPHL